VDDTGPSHNPDIGRRIGPYLLVREIGHGGMGTVYLGVRSDGHFFQTVAIKLIRRGMDTEFNVSRFRIERQILAHLNHPYIATLLDGGSTEDGRPYFVMEFIEGQPLLKYCRSQSLSLVKRLELFQQICAAVHYAHQTKVIHRDLKPSNILVTANGTPKLLDFGIAKLLMPDMIADDLTETVSAVRLLTPNYASPEQIYGYPVSIATDIYLLGLVLYELISGEHPFRAEGRSRAEMERAICHEVPAPLSEKAAPEHREFIRRHLEGIVAKALQKEPERRYGDLEQLSADIACSLQQRSLPARGERHKSFIPQLWILTYSVLIAGFLAAMFVLLPFHRRDSQRSVSSILVLPFANLSSEPRIEHFSDGLTEEITTELARLPEVRVLARTTAFQFKGTAMDVKEIGRKLGVGEVLEGSVRREGDRARITAQLIHVADGYHVWAETYERSLGDALLVQREISREIATNLEARLSGRARWRGRGQATPNQQALADYLEANRLLDRDKIRATVTSGLPLDLRRVISLLERATQRDPQFAQAWAGLADMYEFATDFDQGQAAVMRMRAMASALRALEVDDTLAEAHAVLGSLRFFQEWDFPGAEASLRRAVEINPRVTSSLRDYIDLLRLSGRYEESGAILSYAEMMAPNAPEIAIQRALLLYSQRQYEKALQHADRVMTLRANYLPGLWMQGLCLERLSRWSEAEEKYRRVLVISRADSRALPALGYLLGKTGRKDEAVSILQTLTAQNRSGPARGYAIALVYAGLGDVPRALDSLEMGFKQHDSSMPYLGVEQRFETIASHSRFRALLSRMNLPESIP